MIGYLKGNLLSIDEGTVLIDVNGVGYEVIVGNPNAATPVSMGEAVSLWIHTHVREDQITLFGFKETVQKQIFLVLTGITGIGPKLAMAVVASLSPGDLVEAVTVGDTGMLRSVPGVGKKMADRMVLELKDKLGGVVKETEWKQQASGGSAHWSDLTEALSGLGFSDGDIRNVIKLLRTEVKDQDLEINQLLKLALQKIKN